MPSHWLLDLVVHRPDLPFYPGPSPKVGLGLWHSLPGTLVVELGLLAVGLWVTGAPPGRATAGAATCSGA